MGFSDGLTPTYSPIRPQDLEDKTVTRLNTTLKYLWANSPITNQSASSTWAPYIPVITPSAGMTATGQALTNADFFVENNRTSLLIDITFTIGGTLGNLITISFPKTPAFPNTGAAFSCAIISSGTPSIGVAYMSAGVVAIQLSGGANFLAGPTEVILSGFYQT